jgi:hypothetical protein
MPGLPAVALCLMIVMASDINLQPFELYSEFRNRKICIHFHISKS